MNEILFAGIERTQQPLILLFPSTTHLAISARDRRH
jgi:hypothetical protein